MKGIEVALETIKMTNTDLANKLGIAKQNISRWISGERKIPDKYLKKLSDILFVPAEILQRDFDDLEKVTIQADIYHNLAVINDDEVAHFQAIRLRELAETAIVKRDINELLDYYNDGGEEEIFEILENISIILKLRKIDLFTLKDITETILYNMESEIEKDDYVRTFQKRYIGEYRINFERELLNLIAKYEMEREEHDKEDD